MCGDSGCALSDSELGTNAACTLFTQVRNGTVARASRSTTTGQYTHCWDALGNAISQCFRDTSVAYTGKEGKMQGNWALDGEIYWIQIISGDSSVCACGHVSRPRACYRAPAMVRGPLGEH